MQKATCALGGLIAVGVVFAFVGLSNRGFWTDELFTLFVIDHHGGALEVWRRALTDTHPPVYYFLAHAWGVAFGYSETPLRCLSALCAVAALVVWLIGAGPLFSWRARLFAAVVAASSSWWFIQSQNARSYGLDILAVALLAVVLARAKRAADFGARTLPAWILALCALGALVSFIHFYAFLTVGLVFLAALVSIRDRFARIVVFVSGVAIAGLQAVFVVTLMKHSQADFRHMWFETGAVFLTKEIAQAFDGFIGPGAVVALVALVIGARRGARLGLAAIWSAKAGILVYLGVLLIGILVTLFLTPSFAQQNLQVANPLLWPAVAAIWEAGAEAPGRSWPAWAAIVGLALQTPIVAVRFLPYGEAWRESAAYVSIAPGCADQRLPVLLPAHFGPPTPFYERLAETAFYGHYLGSAAGRPLALTAQEILDPRRNPNLGNPPRGCGVLAWAVHDIDHTQARSLARHLAAAAGVSPQGVSLRSFTSYRLVWGFPVANPTGFVVVRN